MSNIALFSGSAVPAFAKKGELSALAKSLAGGAGGAGGKRISIKGGVFRLMSAGKEVASIDDRHLNVVLVKAAPKISRVFYMKSYDSENVGAPDCWSADGVKPSSEETGGAAAGGIRSPYIGPLRRRPTAHLTWDVPPARAADRAAMASASRVPAVCLKMCDVPFIRKRRVRIRLCTGCGYGLRTSTGRCPECGMPFVRSAD